MNAEGTFALDEHAVNAYLRGRQEHPAVDSLPQGGHVVVWASCPADGQDAATGQDGDGCGIFAQRFNPDGAKLYH